MRRPADAPYSITQDAAEHIRNGGGAADDYAVPRGRPVKAMFAGTFYRRGPYPGLGRNDPGLSGDVETAGLFGRSAHFDSYVSWLASGMHVEEGQTIGYAGDTGYAFGVHVHAYLLVNGVRWGIEEYLTAIRAAGSGEVEIIPTTPRRKKRRMSKMIVGFNDTNNYYIFDTSPTLEAKQRYTQILNGGDLSALVRIYGDAITFANQGEWDVVRTKYGIGDKVTQPSPQDLLAAIKASDGSGPASPLAGKLTIRLDGFATAQTD